MTDKVKGGSWVWDSSLGKLVPKHLYQNVEPESAAIHGTIEPFISPIDKSVIDDRKKLRAHNMKHGVTDSRDYSADHFKKADIKRNAELEGRTPKQKQERIETIKRAIYRREHGYRD